MLVLKKNKNKYQKMKSDLLQTVFETLPGTSCIHILRRRLPTQPYVFRIWQENGCPAGEANPMQKANLLGLLS